MLEGVADTPLRGVEVVSEEDYATDQLTDNVVCQEEEEVRIN